MPQHLFTMRTILGGSLCQTGTLTETANPEGGQHDLSALYTSPEPPPPPSLQVDGEAAENVIAEKRIGERIKHLRLKKSMGLVELGQHTGLSASFLSQLETGRVVPTLRNLARISMVFSKDLSYFFEPEPQTLFRVHRAQGSGAPAAERRGGSLVLLREPGLHGPRPAAGSLLRGVSAAQEGQAGARAPACWLRVPAAADGQAGSAARRGDAPPGSGDAAYFDADTIHSYICVGEVAATAVIVTLQQPVATPYTGGPRTGPTAGTGPNRVRALRPTLLRTQATTGHPENPDMKKTPA